MIATEADRKAAYRYIAAVLEGTAERGCGGLSGTVAVEVMRVCKAMRAAGEVPVTVAEDLAPKQLEINGHAKNGAGHG